MTPPPDATADATSDASPGTSADADAGAVADATTDAGRDAPNGSPNDAASTNVGPEASAGHDAAVDAQVDAAFDDGSHGAAPRGRRRRHVRTGTPSCSCRMAGPPTSSQPFFAAALFACGVLARRRARSGRRSAKQSVPMTPA